MFPGEKESWNVLQSSRPCNHVRELGDPPERLFPSCTLRCPRVPVSSEGRERRHPLGKCHRLAISGIRLGSLNWFFSASRAVRILYLFSFMWDIGRAEETRVSTGKSSRREALHFDLPTSFSCKINFAPHSDQRRAQELGSSRKTPWSATCSLSAVPDAEDPLVSSNACHASGRGRLICAKTVHR